MRDFLLSIATPEKLSWIGFLILIGGLLGEIAIASPEGRRLNRVLVFLFAAVVLSGHLISHMGEEERSAQLTERAKRAELELSRLKSPRIITDHDFQTLVARLRPFAGKNFWIITQRAEGFKYGEQINLSQQLLRAFSAGGWVKSNRSSTDQTKVEDEFRQPNDRGCAVASGMDPSSMSLGKSVLDALHEIGIECEASPDGDIIPNFIVIEVGLR